MTQPASNETTDIEKEPESLHQAVMESERARNAFYNTTVGVLLGRPEDEELRKVKRLLDERRIAYLFSPDRTRPRPMFLTRKSTFVGAERIWSHIESIPATMP